MFSERGPAPEEFKDTSQESSLDRRAFLKGLVAAGAVAGVRELLIDPSEARADENEKRDMRELAETFEDGKNRMLEYHPYRGELSPLLMKSAEAVARYQQAIVGHSGGPVKGEGPRELPRGNDYLAESAKAQKVLWEELAAMPEIRAARGADCQTFSPGALGRLVLEELPQLFAKEGVFAKIIFQQIVNGETGETEILNPTLDLHPVEKVEPYALTELWGKEFSASAITVGETMAIGGRAFPSLLSKNNDGQAFYGNIIIYGGNLDKNFAEYESLKPQFEQVAQTGIIEADFQELYGFSVDRKTDIGKVVYLRVMARYLRGLKGKKEWVGAHLDYIKAHEAKHLQDAADPEFFKIADSAGHDQSWYVANRAVHEEINGLLTEQRYYPQNPEVFLDLFNINSKDEDPYHVGAALWVRERAVDVIQADPKHFGLHIYPEVNLPEREQYMAQLYVLAESDPSALSRLADEVMKIHRSQYKSDFTNGILREFKPSQTSGMGELAAEILGAAGAIGIIGIGLKKFFARREQVAKEERAAKANPSRRETGSKRKKRKQK